MSLNHRQLRRLHRIESGLFRSDPQLAAMLVMFARLAAGEDLPVWEQEATRPGCIRQSAALIVKAVTVLVEDASHCFGLFPAPLLIPGNAAVLLISVVGRFHMAV